MSLESVVTAFEFAISHARVGSDGFRRVFDVTERDKMGPRETGTQRVATKTAADTEKVTNHEKTLVGTKNGAGDDSSIRKIIGPLIISDVKCLTALPSAGAIEKHFFPLLFKPRDHGMVAYPGGIRRIERGDCLPSLQRLKEISAGHMALSRVIRSRLARALFIFASPSDQKWLNQAQQAYGTTYWPNLVRTSNKSQARPDTQRGLRYIVRKSDVEALATMLNRIPLDPPVDKPSAELDELASSIGLAATRLAVFPPFHTIRNEFLTYIRHSCLKSLSTTVPWRSDTTTVLIHNAVIALGRIGLVPDNFGVQMRLVRWLEHEDVQAITEAAGDVALATGPVALLPSNPLIPVMKHLQHWKTHTEKPIEFDTRANRVFYIANAFDIISKPYPDELEEIRRPLDENDLKWRQVRRDREVRNRAMNKSAKTSATETKRWATQSWPQGGGLGAGITASSSPPTAHPDAFYKTRADPMLHASRDINRKALGHGTMAQEPSDGNDQHRFHDKGCPQFAGFSAQLSSVQVSRLTGVCNCIHRSKLDGESVTAGQIDPHVLDSGPIEAGQSESHDR